MRQLLVLLMILFAVPAFAWGGCDETKLIELDFNASDWDEMELKALAGELEVTSGNSDTIDFRGEVCASSKKYLDMMDVDVLKEGDKLTLAAIIPYHQDDFDPSYATIDILLTVPTDLPLRLRDSSGDILVRDVHLISVEDSSGDMKIQNSTGDLAIRDSSGNIDVRRVTGNVTVTDSSGDIDIDTVSENVFIPGDSSGDIDVENVSGTVTVDRDGSGSITIDSTGQDVVIGRDGSGNIDIDGVKGNVSIEADGSGRLSVKDVDGDLDVGNKGSGDIRTVAIRGNVNTPR